MHAADHAGPLLRLAARAEHQMVEAQEDLYAELRTTGSSAWSRLHGDVTSQLTADGRGRRPDRDLTDGRRPRHGLDRRSGRAPRRVRGRAGRLADGRRAVRGGDQRDQGRGRRRQPPPPLAAPDRRLAVRQQRRQGDVRCHAGGDRRPASPTSAAGCGPRPGSHGHDGALPWWDLFAPLPIAGGEVAWSDGVALVDDAFSGYSPHLADVLHRAVSERWIDAEPRVGKVDGAFCCRDHRRPLDRADELEGQQRQRADPGARARPRLPQRATGPAHEAAAAAADGAGRDRQHLLRDVDGGTRAGGGHRCRAAGPARHEPARRQPGRRRHPQPVPVRVGRVRAPAPAERCRRTSSAG